MDATTLVTTYPRLFHIAEHDAWPSIRRYGLLSTSALLELFEIAEPRRSQLLEHRRDASVVINHPVHGRATVRDNLPLHEGKLAACLTDMTVEAFMRRVNEHVFFWPNMARLDSLFNAAAYASRRHLILELDAPSLIAAHEHSVR
ncbi:MAG: DUF7002 family protein, partial [Phycisphaerales bacterium JB038]